MSICCKKGGCIQDLRMGSCLTLRSELLKTPILAKQETLLARGARVESSKVKEPKRMAATWLPVLGFIVMGLVSKLSPVNHSDAGSFLVLRASLRQDGFQRGRFWEDMRTGISYIFLPFLNSSSWWGLVNSTFLTRNSCRKWSLWCLARVGGFSQRFP